MNPLSDFSEDAARVARDGIRRANRWAVSLALLMVAGGAMVALTQVNVTSLRDEMAKIRTDAALARSEVAHCQENRAAESINHRTRIQQQEKQIEELRARVQTLEQRLQIASANP